MRVTRHTQQDERDRHHAHAQPLTPARLNPKYRSASTASRTNPPDSTAWASDSGSSDSAATCATNATTAMDHPMVHHFE